MRSFHSYPVKVACMYCILVCRSDGRFNYDGIPYHLGITTWWYGPSDKSPDIHHSRYHLYFTCSRGLSRSMSSSFPLRAHILRVVPSFVL
ncbi:hypothetical protein SCLCIDRAFT_266550 [Scleroderma citrinum Foug A]|uniref:Uncharacterized protein n=1 Tax=Scleroderma citrinum Foug A TaxID=1036808 RepID=A0A0C3D5R9_9AGAM|nr:hypothetical protein SCLCIDRAFT_266550 [Scleroderma citrinum Foug A]